MSSRASACLLWAMYLRERGRGRQVPPHRPAKLGHPQPPSGDSVRAPSPTTAAPPWSRAGGSAEGPERGWGPLPAASTRLTVAKGRENRPLHPECFPPGTHLTGDRSWEKLASQLQMDRNLMGNKVHTE